MKFNKKIALIIVIICFLGSLVFLSYSFLLTSGKLKNPIDTNQSTNSDSKNPKDMFDTLSVDDKFDELNATNEKYSDIYSLLVLGNDKRYEQETSFRTDTILVISINKKTNEVLFTSVPRDSWLTGKRINEIFIVDGEDELKKQMTIITGLPITNFAMIDFAHFVDMIDAIGGLTIDVPNGFTDEDYPNDRQGGDGIHTVTINSGTQIMDGETALVYSRSRKGNNREGSDFKRMKRQQNILKALPASFFKAKNFNPNNAEAIFNQAQLLLTMDVKLDEFLVLFDMLKDHDKYIYKNLVLSTTNYLYNPPLQDYGGAYVLRPNDESFEEVRTEVARLIGL